MFTYFHDGLPVSRQVFFAAVGVRYVTSVAETIAAGNGTWQAGRWRVEFKRGVDCRK